MPMWRRFSMVVFAFAILMAPLGVAWAKPGHSALAGVEMHAAMEHCDMGGASDANKSSGCCTPDSGCVPETCSAKCLTSFNLPAAVQAAPDFRIASLFRREPHQPPAWATSLLSPPPRS